MNAVLNFEIIISRLNGWIDVGCNELRVAKSVAHTLGNMGRILEKNQGTTVDNTMLLFIWVHALECNIHNILKNT